MPETAKPAKIALVNVVGLRGIPGIMGGVESHCEELLPRIAERASDLDIEVVARQPYVSGHKRTAFRGVHVTPLFSPKKQSFEAIVSTLVGVLHARRRGADLIHIHAVGPALLTPLARILGMKVVVTHHGTDYDREKWGMLAKVVLRLGERLGVRFANAVIAVAPSLAGHLRTRFPAQAPKIHYVPNGKAVFAVDEGADSILDELALQPRDFVLAVGRLVPEKGFHLLVEAMRMSGSTRKLVIVGGADHESRYSRDLLRQQTPDMIFAGVRKRDVLKKLYENAALFVLPSSHEGLPIAALEAGSFGCPMLLSDIQANRDLGLPERNYFPSGDRAALAECLTKSAEHFAVSPDRFERFDWDRIADETLVIYRSALTERC